MKIVNPLSKLIDHTLLKPIATQIDIKNLCMEAIDYEFMSVCVNPVHVALCAKFLEYVDVKTCTVVGFPLGANSINHKCSEASIAVTDGATEVDMVMNIGAFKEKDYRYVLREIHSVVQTVGDCMVKVIIETGWLNEEEIIQACKIINDSEAHFIKTSTGFKDGGNATIQNIELINNYIDKSKKIKASGGIRTLAQLNGMVNAGAHRIGTSSGIDILNENQNQIKLNNFKNGVIMKNTENKWTIEEFQAYLYLYAVQANLSESVEEQEFIGSNLNADLVKRMRKEIGKDNDYQRVQKVMGFIDANNYSKEDLENLLNEVKEIFLCDDKFDSSEKQLFSFLKKLFKV
ncbi:MAG: deoxyribose-phosphate aldolase [Candidatus Marinimicrobia bacterium]|nr:deoxyribose-phosphate aldolase [Candidatus Neomarinimicrobiota bacterium]